MLNNNNSEIKHGLLDPNKKTTKSNEISDESLNAAIQILKTQVQEYHNAGLTQVSAWL